MITESILVIYQIILVILLFSHLIRIIECSLHLGNDQTSLSVASLWCIISGIVNMKIILRASF